LKFYQPVFRIRFFGLPGSGSVRQRYGSRSGFGLNIFSKSNKQKNLGKNNNFVGILKVTDEKEQDPDQLIRGTDPDPYQNVTDPEHCYQLLRHVRSRSGQVEVGTGTRFGEQEN
jgi:hypothetical protein